MTPSASEPARHVLKQACSAVGLDSDGAEPLRLAENQIWRLPRQRVIVRIARENVPAVRLVDVEQPVEADGRPVTFWAELPPQQHGSVKDVAELLARLHSLTTPAIELGYLDPFVRVGERLHAATHDPRRRQAAAERPSQRPPSGLGRAAGRSPRSGRAR
ncbi:hypothetical protein [Streptomyces californicus]|uniref:hypothetical protein n=1 Tax=Streptomyces californicus TaxID=67351 RepID=UPI003401140D